MLTSIPLILARGVVVSLLVLGPVRSLHHLYDQFTNTLSVYSYFFPVVMNSKKRLKVCMIDKRNCYEQSIQTGDQQSSGAKKVEYQEVKCSIAHLSTKWKQRRILILGY